MEGFHVLKQGEEEPMPIRDSKTKRVGESVQFRSLVAKLGDGFSPYEDRGGFMVLDDDFFREYGKQGGRALRLMCIALIAEAGLQYDVKGPFKDHEGRLVIRLRPRPIMGKVGAFPVSPPTKAKRK